ncbi:MAG TPA: hypothetical protein VF653_15265 [Methylomirabilota bacterium]
MGLFKVQRGVKNVPLAGTTETVTAVSSIERAFLLNGNNRHANAKDDTIDVEVDDTCASMDLTDTTTITFTRVAGSINESRFQSWELLESLHEHGLNDFRVISRNTVTITAGNEDATDTLDTTPCDIDQCTVHLLGVLSTATTNAAHTGSGHAYLDEADGLLHVKRSGATGDVTFEIVVVEWGYGWSVYHGRTNDYNTDTTTVTLKTAADGQGGSTADVGDWANAVIFGHWRGDDNDDNQAVADTSCIFEPGGDTSTVAVEHHSGHDGIRNQVVVHVLVHPEMRVTRYSSTEGDDENQFSIDITSAGITDTEQCFLVHSRYVSGTGNAYSRGWSHHLLISATQADIFGRQGAATVVNRLQVVDLVEIGRRRFEPPLLEVEARVHEPEIVGAEDIEINLALLLVEARVYEPEIDVLDVTLNMPLLSVEADVLDLEFFGNFAEPDTLNVEATVFAPTLAFSITMAQPKIAVEATLFAPTIQTQYSQPLQEVLATLFAPEVLTPLEIDMPLLDVEATVTAPAVSGGVNVIGATIGTGQDYATIELWEDDTDIDVVGDQVIYEGRCINEAFTGDTGTSPRITIAGATVNATYHRRLTAQAGAEFNPNTGQGARVVNTVGTGGIILLSIEEDFFEMSHLGFIDQPNAGLTNGRTCVRVSGCNNAWLDACYSEIKTGLNGIGFECLAGPGVSANRFTNCIVRGQSIDGGASAGLRWGFRCTADLTTLYNCAAYRCGTDLVGGTNQRGILNSASNAITRNCISLETHSNQTGELDFETGGGATSHNISSDSSASGTGSITGGVAADIWIDPDDSDFRIQAASDARDAGVDLSAIFQFDFANNEHNANNSGWEIGPYDEGASGLEVTLTPNTLQVEATLFAPTVEHNTTLDLDLLQVEATLHAPTVTADTPGPPSQPEAAMGLVAAQVDACQIVAAGPEASVAAAASAEAFAAEAAGIQATGLAEGGLEAADIRQPTPTLE